MRKIRKNDIVKSKWGFLILVNHTAKKRYRDGIVAGWILDSQLNTNEQTRQGGFVWQWKKDCRIVERGKKK